MAPVERIKCLLQIQSSDPKPGKAPQYKGMVDCGTQLFRSGGLRSVFRGWQATLVRDIPG
jgi:solute carrier family 25 (mitochondrial carnitine/acylcarnitine transporter), member 20/29